MSNTLLAKVKTLLRQNKFNFFMVLDIIKNDFTSGVITEDEYLNMSDIVFAMMM